MAGDLRQPSSLWWCALLARNSTDLVKIGPRLRSAQTWKTHIGHNFLVDRDTGFPHVLENLENNKINSLSRSWKCPWILQNQEISWKKYCLWKNPAKSKKPLNKYYAYRKMAIIDLTLNKYYMLFHSYLYLLPLNLVYFVLGNGNFVLEKSWKIIFPWLWEPCDSYRDIRLVPKYFLVCLTMT